VLELAGDQVVVGLQGGEPFEATSLRDGQLLHEVPGRQVGAADVAHLARAHQVVQGAQGLLGRRPLVDAVDLVEVDVVGAKPAQARLAGAQDVVAGLPDVVWALPHPRVELGGHEHVVAPTAECPAEYMSAVSNRFTPASRQRSTMAVASATWTEPMLANLPWPPNVIVPSDNADTRTPLLPRNRVSIPATPILWAATPPSAG